MNNADLVRTLFSAVERNDQATAKTLLSPDFVFGGATPKPINADGWLGVHNALKNAMPDYSFNFDGAAEDGNKVRFTVQIKGTHSGPMALPLPGFQPLTATGNKIANPKEHVTAVVANGKVTHVDVEHLDNGGLPELVRQMGGKL